MDIIGFLAENPLLLLFVVAAIGYPLGQIKVGGSSLGVAAVLFVGLAIGALDPRLKLPEIVYILGLVLFVYSVGLASGPGFFASLRRKGLRDNLMVVGILLFAAAVAYSSYFIFDLKATLVAGMFSGSLTNTPALAGALEFIKTEAPKENLETLLAEPVVSYSVTYPMGVIAMIVSIYIFQRLWKVDYARESRTLKDAGGTGEEVFNRTVLVQNPEVEKHPVAVLMRSKHWEVMLGRLKREGHLSLVGGKTVLQRGDQVSIIGTKDELEKAIPFFGQESEEHIELDRTELDFRRMFISNPKIVGIPLRDLNLLDKYGAIISRVRRGDMEFLPRGDTILELGDRVRVVSPRQKLSEVAKYLGDSYRALSEIDVLSFSLGITIGILIGAIPIPLPGGITFKLGNAGGPLIVALIVGKIHRTGPITWNLPYSANMLMRQFGLILFLASIGTRAGYPFVNTFTSGGGITIFLVGMFITISVSLLALIIGHKIFKIPMSLLVGMMSGLQTQPAVLGFALDQTKNDLPNIGYSTVFPVAIITKILLAQILLALLL